MFSNVHEGTGSKHEDCCRTHKKLEESDIFEKLSVMAQSLVSYEKHVSSLEYETCLKHVSSLGYET